MDYIKKHKIRKLVYGIMGIIVIPVYSYFYSKAGPGDGFLQFILVTFSQIGARYGGVEDLIIWGIVTAVYYFSLLKYIIDLTKIKSLFINIFLGINCGSILLTVFLPFAPEIFPITSEVHNILGYVTAISSLITMFSLVLKFFKKDPVLFARLIFTLSSLVIIFYLVFSKYGVSSLFQLVITSGLCMFVFLVLCLLEKSEAYDIFSVLKESEELEYE